jgi:hypothetical protein
VQDFMKLLESSLGDNSWLTTLGLWYIGWNLRSLKNAPSLISKSIETLLDALNTHTKLMEDILANTRKASRDLNKNSRDPRN